MAAARRGGPAPDQIVPEPAAESWVPGATIRQCRRPPGRPMIGTSPPAPLASLRVVHGHPVAVGRVVLVAGILILLFIPYLLWGTGLITAHNQSLLRAVQGGPAKADSHPAEPRCRRRANPRCPGGADHGRPRPRQPGGDHPDPQDQPGHDRGGGHRRGPAGHGPRPLPDDPAARRGRQRRHRRAPDHLPPPLLQPTTLDPGDPSTSPRSRDLPLRRHREPDRASRPTSPWSTPPRRPSSP